MKKIITHLLGLAFATTSFAFTPNQWVGVNLSGGQFGASNVPGRYGYDYIYPTDATIAQYQAIGINFVRIPFLWERVQPSLDQAISTVEVQRIMAAVKLALARNMTVLLDMHDFGGYYNNPVGSASVPASAFAAFWVNFSQYFSNMPSVYLGLMNEPHTQLSSNWATYAQSAITAIRSAGITNGIMLSGTSWDGAHSWLSPDSSGISNGSAIAAVQDPLGNTYIEMHEYFDSDFSGTHSTCSAPPAETTMQNATNWLRSNNLKGFIGEFGSSTDASCINLMNNFFNYLGNNRDVWAGWAYYDAAPWNSTYMYSIYPPTASAHPQVVNVQNAIQGN